MATEREVCLTAALQRADMVERFNEELGLKDANGVVRELPAGVFTIRPSLNAVLSRAQKSEFESLLQELCELNTRYVGMRSVEAEVNLMVLEDAQELLDKFVEWFSDLARKRAAKDNPRDAGDPFKRFARLHSEFQEFFENGIVIGQPESISYVFFDRPAHQYEFIIFSHCFSPYLTQVCGRADFNDAARAKGEQFVSRLASSYLQIAVRHCWHLDRFLPFLEDLSKCARIVEGIQRHPSRDERTICAEAAKIARDIWYLRQFLSGSPNDEFILDLGGFLVGFHWGHRNGIAQLCIGSSREDVVKTLLTHAVTVRSLPSAVLQRDGRFADICCPWVTTDDWSNPDRIPVVLTLLESIYDVLFAAFSKIDFDDVREQALNAQMDCESDDQALAVSLWDLEDHHSSQAPATSADVDILNDKADDQAEAVRQTKPKNPQLRTTRQSTLLRFLERYFHCRVLPGKGSEINVFRNDQFWKLGRHKQDREISVGKLKEGLRALKISLYEWYACVSSLRKLKSLH